MSRPLVLILIALLGTAAGPAQPQSAVQLQRAPEGGIQPQAMVDAAGRVHLLYYKGEAGRGDLFYVRQDRGATAWSAPLRVNSRPASAVAAGTIRGGQLALGKDGRPHVLWFGSEESGIKAPLDSAPVLYSRLSDNGAGFEPMRNLAQRTGILDGGGSVAADGQGNVYATWHAAESRGSGESARRLWVARSRDSGRTFTAEEPAFAEPTGACPCCSAKAFADSRGAVYLLFRSATEKVNRDLYLLTSRDGARFTGARLDPWPVPT